jgi:hypothetical protein
MSNPFETIDTRLSNIENLLLDLKHSPNANTNHSIVANQWISDPDAAKMLKVCTRQMYNLRITGELGFTKINGKVFYKISDIEFLLEKNYVKSFKNNSLKK